MKSMYICLLLAILIMGEQVSYGQQNGDSKSLHKGQVQVTNRVNELPSHPTFISLGNRIHVSC